MGSDFPKAHTATRAKLASHKIIQQNSDQNLPLRNICLIKSGLHHSNCIFFPIFNFKLEEIMILGQKHMIFCLKKKHVLKGLLFQQLLFYVKLKNYADLKEHFFFIFSSQCLSTGFFGF